MKGKIMKEIRIIIVPRCFECPYRLPFAFSKKQECMHPFGNFVMKELPRTFPKKCPLMQIKKKEGE